MNMFKMYGLFVCVLICNFVYADSYTDPGKKFINPFMVQGNWYKANLHTHTTLSDGDVNLPVRIQQYKDKGYNVLAVSDHWKTNDISGLSTRDLLIISAIELNEKRGGVVPYHLVGLNVPRSFVIGEDSTPQEKIDKVKALGGETIYCHPYWSGLTINDALAIHGYCAMEVFNGSCRGNNKSYASVHWDDMLSTGMKINAVAVDDTHSDSDVARGWIMVRAGELSAGPILNAIRTGCFYASTGPVITDFKIDENNLITFECSPVKEIHLMSAAWSGKSFFAEKGQLISKAKAHFGEDIEYVRAEVIDIQGNHAWTNPIYLK
jgi:predicted metal-dependent phosphoesterase TrpH